MKVSTSAPLSVGRTASSKPTASAESLIPFDDAAKEFQRI